MPDVLHTTLESEVVHSQVNAEAVSSTVDEFDTIRSQIAALQESTDPELEARVTTAEGEIDTLQGEMVAQQTLTTSLNSVSNNHTTQIGLLGSDISSLQSTDSSHNSRLTSVELAIAGLETVDGGLDTRLIAAELAIDELEASAGSGGSMDYNVEDNGMIGNITSGTFTNQRGIDNATAFNSAIQGILTHRKVVRLLGKEFPLYGTGTIVGAANSMKAICYGPSSRMGLHIQGTGMGDTFQVPGSQGDGSYTRLVWTGSSLEDPASPLAMLALLGYKHSVRNISFQGERIDISGNPGRIPANLSGLAILKGASSIFGSGKHTLYDLNFSFLDVGIQISEPVGIAQHDENEDECTYNGFMGFDHCKTAVSIDSEQAMSHVFPGSVECTYVQRVFHISEGGKLYQTGTLDVIQGLASSMGGDDTATILYLSQPGTGSNNGIVTLSHLNFDNGLGANGRWVDCDITETSGTCKITIRGATVSYDDYEADGGYLVRLSGLRSITIYDGNNIQAKTFRLIANASSSPWPQVTFIGCTFAGVATLRDVVDEVNSTANGWDGGLFKVRCIGCNIPDGSNV